MKEYSLYINGRFEKAALSREIINPSSGEAIARVSMADAGTVDYAIRSAREAYDKGPWRNFSLDKRRDLILELSEKLLGKARELAEVESLNSGKPIKETTFMDIPSSAQTFRHFAENLKFYLEPETIEIKSQAGRAKADLIHGGRGVVGLIVPWNYPLLIASWKMAQALSAGNTVVLKPSTSTPLSALELAEIVDELDFPKGVVNIITGKGDEAGKTICTNKYVDMVSFTGSNEVGKRIMGYASESIKKLIMELGGKSASIVLEDSDLDLAVNGSLCSIFLNQGQMCTATSRILVSDKIYDEFRDKFTQRAKSIKLGQAMDFQTQMGPLMSEAQRRRVLSFIDKARREGLKILCGGKIPESPALKKGFFFEPTVIEGKGAESFLFREEIFGPVAVIDKFSGIGEAVSLANDSDFALAGCIWSKDKDKAANLAKDICAGTVWINTYGMFFNELSYGGFKQSGFGKELGKQGFLEYTSLKNVITDQTQNGKSLVNYWYGF
ncbi:MAG: aldehyde dehydrogenase family protein [Candidatus Omnitrophica bacterium]|nr:aldehyde dehydrogenase family protein [Candidatus Omnitrophota bacterium]MBD3269379.1 aldehyde dehydrogenase family protein [Candidatus Omnitrophota bacterium]